MSLNLFLMDGHSYQEEMINISQQNQFIIMYYYYNQFRMKGKCADQDKQLKLTTKQINSFIL